MKTAHSESESISLTVAALAFVHDVHTRPGCSSIVPILSNCPLDKSLSLQVIDTKFSVCIVH